METVNGQTFYEAEIILDGQKVDIKVTADGTLLDKKADDDEDEGDYDDNDNNERGD